MVHQIGFFQLCLYISFKLAKLCFGLVSHTFQNIAHFLEQCSHFEEKRVRGLNILRKDRASYFTRKEGPCPKERYADPHPPSKVAIFT